MRPLIVWSRELSVVRDIVRASSLLTGLGINLPCAVVDVPAVIGFLGMLAIDFERKES